jgi:hypothetical protein
MTLYSFTDMTGVFSHPLGGNFILGGGEIGLDEIEIEMANEKTKVKKSADGSIMLSYVAGDNATAKFTMQQTSDLHHYFLNTYNLCKTQADAGNLSVWAAGQLSVKNILDGSQHNASGVCFQKVPPKSYQEDGQMISWMFILAQCDNE